MEERSTHAKNVPDQVDLRDMKAIFSALNLDDDQPGVLLNSAGRKPSIIDTTLAAGQAHALYDRPQANAHFQDDVYELRVDADRGFWDGQQGGVYGIQKP